LGSKWRFVCKILGKFAIFEKKLLPMQNTKGLYLIVLIVFLSGMALVFFFLDKKTGQSLGLTSYFKIIQTDKAPLPIGPYSQATRTDEWVFLSGQIGLGKNGDLMNRDFETETHQVMKNIESILFEAGMSFRNVVKVTVYLKDLQQFERFNAVYSNYFSGHLPAREVIEVSKLPKGAQVEVSCIAFGAEK
jgi:2-iminobutanoate/2-iminopropanoate deaminase